MNMQRLRATLQSRVQGLLVSIVVGAAALFLSEHYGAPAMLMALLLGMALHVLSENGPCKRGIDFTSRTVLRLGVALLGARVSVGMIAELGPHIVLIVAFGVILTILFGLLASQIMGRGWRFGLLTGGSVAICGASAAMALSAVLPRNEHSEQNLIFTVLSVTLLSTIAMITYPVLTGLFGFEDVLAGVLLGGTIHDVAQVVGAGFSISQEAGEVATLVKLIRVALLAPVVLVISIAVRRYVRDANSGETPPILPMFVLGFLCLAALNSAALIPEVVVTALSELSRWALLVAVAAVGMKTSVKHMMKVSGQAVVLVIGETLFLLVFVLASIALPGR